ncbi:MAG: DNA-3-methyladenine glycosylase, partial [Candidatus Angelobacter sp.]
LEPVAGFKAMARARRLEEFETASVRDLRKLTSGPGRLTEALGITRPRDNAKDVLSLNSNLQILDDGFRPERVRITPRIGITKSAEMPLRYIVPESPFLSRK